MDRIARKAIVVSPLRRVLQDDDVRAARRQDLEAAWIRRVHQTPLAFDHDHVGRGLLPRRPDRVLDLARDEIVDQRVEDDAVSGTLHPGGLTGADQLAHVSRALKSLDQPPSRGALADR